MDRRKDRKQNLEAFSDLTSIHVFLIPSQWSVVPNQLPFIRKKNPHLQNSLVTGQTLVYTLWGNIVQ